MNIEKLDELVLELERRRYFLESTPDPVPEKDLAEMIDLLIQMWQELKLPLSGY